MNLSARRLVASFTLACFVLQPGIITAQLAADPRAGSGMRPVVEAAANGVPLVQIAPASGAGVSRNQFTQYNVDPRGVVLNNATAAARTQQAGWVDANPHLAGRAARVILNEVTGADASRLHGYTEVGGHRAEVVIANPNGITCNGCGFINASRGVLSTGSPVVGPDGGLAALQVAGGTLTIEGQGLNAANVDRLDLIARAVALNASIWANQLNVVAGLNRVDYPGLLVTPGGAGGSPAGVAIDVAALGGMYANRIRLVGTEAGVGVNSRGTIAATGGDLTITSEGRVVLAGATSAAVNAAVEARYGIVQSGTAYAGGTARFATGGVLENSGVTAAGADLVLAGRTVSQKGTAAAGSDSAGNLGTHGALSIDAEEVALASGRNLAAARISITGAAVDLSGARTSAGSDLTVVARAGDIDHRGATLQVGGAATVRAAGAIRNDAGVFESGARLEIEASPVANAAGRIAAAGAGAVRVQAAGTLDNGAGFLGANGVVDVVADVLDNRSGTVVAGEGVAVRASRIVSTRGSIGARGDAQFSAHEFSNEQGTFVARGALAVDVAALLDNRGGALSAGRAIAIAAGAVDNRDGVIESGEATNGDVGGALRNDAGRIVAHRLELRAESIANRAGTLYAAADGSVAADSLDNTSGAIATGGSLVAATGSVANGGGLVSANADVRLVTGSFTGGGEMLAGRDLSLDITGDFAHPSGARLHAERDLRVTASGTTANAGTLAALGTVAMEARSITNHATGTIGGSTVALVARDALRNHGRIDGDVVRTRSGSVENAGSIFGGAILIETERLANVGPAGTVASTGDMSLLARSAVENRDGATVFAGGDAALAAGRDLGVGPAIHREGSKTTAASLQSHALAERQISSRVGAGGDLALSAGEDLQLTGAAVSAGRDAYLAAGRNVSIGAATDRVATSGSARGPRYAHDWRQIDETTVGSSVQAGRDVAVASETGNALVEGSRLGAGSGALTLSVPGDITARAGVERDESYSYLSMERRGLLSRRTTENRSLEASSLAAPSTLSGDTVTLQAGGAIDVLGSNVVGVGDVRIRAGGDIGVAGVAQQSTSERYQAERRSGFLGSGGGIGLSFGRQSESIDQRTVTTMTAPSTVGSASGRVAVEAAGDYRQRGSDVVGGAGVSISARNVASEAAEERTDFRYLQEYKRSGFTLALSGTGITPLTLAADSVKRANDVQDDRLKALYAFRAARLAARGVAEAADYLSGRGPGFVGISLSYGTAQTKSEQQIASTVARPSTVLSAGDVEVRARTGNLGVTGSTVSGQNVTLNAANDMILRSAENRTTSRSDQTGRTSQGGVGVGWSATGGIGVTVFGSSSRGENSFERGTVTHTEAQVGAVDALTVRSGRDTTLAGAQARGERIEVEVGRNLAIESQQDTDTYRGRQSASGGGASITFGPAGVTGGSVSALGQRGTTDSDYASVNEPSGFFAGERGFRLDVAGNTDLRGGQIASAAPAERNRLSTATLTFSDIGNRAEYEATGSGGGVSVGVAADGKAGGSIAPAIVPTQSDDQQSTTIAAVAPGTIEIRQPGAQVQSLSALSRTPQTQSQPLQNRFDPKKVAENQEAAAVFGQEAFWIIGTYAQSRTRPYEQARQRKEAAEAAARAAQREAERAKTEEEIGRAQARVAAATAAMDQASADMARA